MSDTQQQQVAPAQTYAPAKRGSKVALMLVILLVAMVAFAAAIYFAGGVAYVTSLLGGTPAPAKGPATASAAAVVASPTVAAADLESAKIVYAEQIQSQANIDRLADGDIKSFTVDAVNKGTDSATVNITARFADGTSAPGGLRFVRSGQVWYFSTITGLRTADTKGIADGTNTAKEIAPTLTADQALAQVGVVTPDQEVLTTIAKQQLVNQPVIRDLLDGEYKLYDLSKPVLGPDTFTIPVVFGGPTETAIPASIVIIAKNVEGQDRLFITTFKRD